MKALGVGSKDTWQVHTLAGSKLTCMYASWRGVCVMVLTLNSVWKWATEGRRDFLRCVKASYPDARFCFTRAGGLADSIEYRLFFVVGVTFHPTWLVLKPNNDPRTKTRSSWDKVGPGTKTMRWSRNGDGSGTTTTWSYSWNKVTSLGAGTNFLCVCPTGYATRLGT